MQKLQNHHGSGLVTIPKRHLERDGLVDDDGQVADETQLTVERLDSGVYAIRVCVDDDLPELEDTTVVRRVAAERLLDEDVFGRTEAE